MTVPYNCKEPMIFDTVKCNFKLTCIEGEFNESAIDKETEVVISKSVVGTFIHYIKYKDHLYVIDTENKTITYAGDKSNVGALYYGFAYLHELKNKLFTKKLEGPYNAC